MILAVRLCLHFFLSFLMSLSIPFCCLSLSLCCPLKIEEGTSMALLIAKGGWTGSNKIERVKKNTTLR